jgi:hypothetical protein
MRVRRAGVSRFCGHRRERDGPRRRSAHDHDCHPQGRHVDDVRSAWPRLRRRRRRRDRGVGTELGPEAVGDLWRIGTDPAECHAGSAARSCHSERR